MCLVLMSSLLKQMPILDTMETRLKSVLRNSTHWKRACPRFCLAIGESKKAEYMNIFYTLESSGGKAFEKLAKQQWSIAHKEGLIIKGANLGVE